MRGEGYQHLVGLGIDDLDRIVAHRRGNLAAIGTPGQRLCKKTLVVNSKLWLFGVYIPDIDCTPGLGMCQHRPIGTPGRLGRMQLRRVLRYSARVTGLS